MIPIDQDATGAFLLRHLRISVVVYVVAATGSVVYCLATLHRPHRAILIALAVVAAVTAVGIVNPLRERIVASPHRYRLLYGWSAVTFGFIAVIAYLDGGLRSPFLMLLFVSMQYVAMAYPVSGVLGFSIAADVVVLWLGLVRPDGSSPANTAMVTLVMGIAGLLSAMAARNRDAQQATQDELHQRLVALANEDPLTGCLNRRRFDVVVADELARAVRHDRPISLLILDIDGFKSINDTHGHPVGDAALRALAAVLRDRSRAQDSVARLGGDEFAVVLPDTDPSDAEDLAERLRGAIAGIVDPLPIITSIGVAGGPARLIEAEELVSVADAALYRAKAAGRRAADQLQADSSMPPTIPITTVPPDVSSAGQPTLTATMGSSESVGQ